MEITINNQKKDIAEHLTLFQLVSEQLGDRLKGVAIAVDGQVIPKQSWGETVLKHNQSILIIKATQGG